MRHCFGRCQLSKHRADVQLSTSCLVVSNGEPLCLGLLPFIYADTPKCDQKAVSFTARLDEKSWLWVVSFVFSVPVFEGLFFLLFFFCLVFFVFWESSKDVITNWLFEQKATWSNPCFKL